MTMYVSWLLFLVILMDTWRSIQKCKKFNPKCILTWQCAIYFHFLNILLLQWITFTFILAPQCIAKCTIDYKDYLTHHWTPWITERFAHILCIQIININLHLSQINNNINISLLYHQYHIDNINITINTNINISLLYV